MLACLQSASSYRTVRSGAQYQATQRLLMRRTAVLAVTRPLTARTSGRDGGTVAAAVIRASRPDSLWAVVCERRIYDAVDESYNNIPPLVAWLTVVRQS
ncbi:hypothetical protein B0H17DRAFT_218721 [Mycena rosella]|uniref:Uncharacterized protein n=1 Tax=Mycena rosella TaxID=1033263 RepID=A0AAD7CXQ4_MYCRO|nr:hypothetical protein B0H17DRAFT_218721 [Mycena rosella]